MGRFAIDPLDMTFLYVELIPRITVVDSACHLYIPYCKKIIIHEAPTSRHLGTKVFVYAAEYNIPSKL
jgi:hypothetical protein